MLELATRDKLEQKKFQNEFDITKLAAFTILKEENDLLRKLLTKKIDYV